MKHATLYQCFLLLAIVLFGADAAASWHIDPARYHASVHGQTACTDCHKDASDPNAHPDPENVNRSLGDFFTADTCADCHDSVEDYVDAGEHGGKTVDSAADIENCLGCHDPHYEMGAARPDGYDPAVSLNRQCGLCHENQDRLPDPEGDDSTCLGCHKGSDTREETAAESTPLCLHCHSSANPSGYTAAFPVIDEKRLEGTPHSGVACMTCHTRSDQYKHGRQPPADCLQCHEHHDEMTAHDAHIKVSCQACHLGEGVAEKDLETGAFSFRPGASMGRSSRVHEMIVDDRDAQCSRCHYPGNHYGAAAMALPAKSIICMPCHSAAPTAVDTVTLAALAVFFLGLFALVYSVLGGGMEAGSPSSRMLKAAVIVRKTLGAIFSSRIKIIAGSLFLDGLCQRRLFARSRGRWMIHGLIFYPFVIRFAWAVTVLGVSWLFPDSSLTRAMIDKNHPVTALVFDVTGLMVIMGAGLAVILKRSRPADGFDNMPGPDRMGSGLLLAIVAAGFIVEGMRIAMTGFPAGASWAFAGYGMAKLFTGMTGIADIYGWLWYAHAVLTGLFVAYLPFGRMLHMITAPVVMAMNMLENEKEQE